MKRFRKLFKSESGFTLIELLVVIAVLGILAGIAVPRLTGVTGKARLAEAESALGAIKTSLEMYSVENDNQYPGDGTDLSTVLGDYIDNYSEITSDWTVTYSSSGNINANDNGLFTVTMSQTIGSKTYTATLSHDSSGYADVDTSVTP